MPGPGPAPVRPPRSLAASLHPARPPPPAPPLIHSPALGPCPPFKGSSRLHCPWVLGAEAAVEHPPRSHLAWEDCLHAPHAYSPRAMLTLHGARALMGRRRTVLCGEKQDDCWDPQGPGLQRSLPLGVQARAATPPVGVPALSSWLESEGGALNLDSSRMCGPGCIIHHLCGSFPLSVQWG